MSPDLNTTGLLLAAGLALAGASQALASEGPAYDAAIAELQSMHQSCAAMGGQMVYDDGHLTAVTFSDDGVSDYAVLAERVSCDAAASLFCGSAGCAVSLFATQKGGVVTGPYTLHGVRVETQAVHYRCAAGGEGQVTFAGGDFQLSGC